MAKRAARKTSQLNYALAAIAVLAFVFMAALYAGNGMLNLKRTDLSNVSTERPDNSGSILIVPPNAGNDCQQLLLDNKTGVISENGTVDCRTGEAAAPPREGTAAYVGDAKMNAIRKAFRRD